MKLTDWDINDRPREKLERFGASMLSDAELLAILIGSGSTRQSAVDLMKEILHDCNNNLNTLGKMSITDLEKYHGMGPAKAITIIAACELGKRRAASQPEQRPEMGSATAIYNYMHPKMQDLDVEESWILMMNQAYKLIKAMRLSHGGITETAVDVRVIMKECLLNNATVVALCHNHPSGSSSPSRMDDKLTSRIGRACELMRIYFLDHVIVCDGHYYSYREMGRL